MAEMSVKQLERRKQAAVKVEPMLWCLAAFKNAQQDAGRSSVTLISPVVDITTISAAVMCTELSLA